MHYLSYLKAKACGFKNDYQTFLDRNDHFQSKSQVEYIAQLKEQVANSSLKESTDAYQTLQENMVNELKNSDSFFSKLKGHALSARNKISDLISGHYYAKKADENFYNPVIEKEAEAVVLPISNVESTEIEAKIEINKSVVSNVIKLSQEINEADQIHLSRSNRKADKWKNLSSSHQEILRNYFDAGEKAHTLYTLVKSEPESDLKLNSHLKYGWRLAKSETKKPMKW